MMLLVPSPCSAAVADSSCTVQSPTDSARGLYRGTGPKHRRLIPPVRSAPWSQAPQPGPSCWCAGLRDVSMRLLSAGTAQRSLPLRFIRVSPNPSPKPENKVTSARRRSRLLAWGLWKAHVSCTSFHFVFLKGSRPSRDGAAPQAAARPELAPQCLQHLWPGGSLCVLQSACIAAGPL